MAAFTVHALSAADFNPGTYAYITVQNPTDVARKDCPVVINIKDITAKFKKYTGQQIGIFDGSKYIYQQYDDLNKDGKPDEVAFMLDLKAKESKKLLVRMLPPKFETPNFEKEVYTQMVRKVKTGDVETKEMVTEASSDKDDMYKQMHHHGVAFETDLIAYRLYFDKKQTVDVYGKIKPKLEIAESQWYPTEDQLTKGFGDDILKVGSSVGVGTFKGWDGTQALHFEEMARRTQRIVATGSLRNVVEMEVKGWKYQGKTIDATIRCIQYAHHRDVEVQVQFNADLTDSLIFCTGVQKMEEEKLYTDNAGLVGIWGTAMPMPEPEKEKYGKQTVGLGVVVPAEFAKMQAADTRNHLVLLSNNKTTAIRYYFTAAALKEKKGYKTADEFFKYLESWKTEVLNPVVVSLSEK